MTADSSPDGFAATLRAMRAYTQHRKEVLEQAVQHLDDVPGPDPSVLLDERAPQLRSESALFALTKVAQHRFEHDAEVLDTVVQMIDRAIEMADDRREGDARELLEAMPDLMRQLAPPPRPRPRSDQ